MASFLQDKEFVGGLPLYSANSSIRDVPTSLTTISRLWGARLWLSIASKAPLHLEWITADRLYLGRHWANRKVSTWRPDPVSNQVYNIVDEHASQMAVSDFDAVILPRKPSDADAAEVFSDVWQWWYKRHKLRFLMDDVTVACVLKGTCIMKVVWSQDVKAGTDEPEKIPPETLRKRRGRKRAGTETDADRMPDDEPVTVPSAMDGDVVAMVIDPSNFFIDPGAYELQSAAWCGTMIPMLVAEAKSRWPGFSHLFRAEYSFNQTEIYWRPATFQAFQATQGEAGGAYLNVFEGWEKSRRVCMCGAEDKPQKLADGSPNPEYMPPGHLEGLVRIVMVSATSGEPVVVERQPHFFRHGQYPFAVFRDIPVAKSFWGQGEAAQIKSMQEIRNRIIEQIAINAYLTANSQKLLLPGSGINPQTITNEPGKIYPSKIPNAIQPIPMESIPQYVFQLLALTKEDIHETAGVFTAPPPGIRAGYAIVALLERMSARVKRKTMRFESALRDVVELVIAYYQEFGTEERIARITDSSGQVQFFPFQGSAYARAELDVDINLGSTKPFSRAVLQEMAMPMLKMQQMDGTPVLLPSEYLSAVGWPIQGTIDRNRKLEAKIAAQREQQQTGAMPEGMRTLLGDQAGVAPPQMPGQPRSSPETRTPGIGQGNGRGPQGRMMEGLGKAGGGGQ